MKTLTKLNEILKDIKKRFGKKLNGIQKDKIYTRNELREQFKKYSNDKYHVQDFLKKPFDLPLRFLNEIHPYIKNTFTSASYDQTKHKVIIEGKSFKYGFKINDLSNFCLPFMRLLALHYKAFTKEDLKDVPLTAKMIEDTFANEFEKKDEEKEDIKDEWYLDKIKIFKDNIKNIKFVFKCTKDEKQDYMVVRISRIENYRGFLIAHTYQNINGNKNNRMLIDLLTGFEFGKNKINEPNFYRNNIDKNFNETTSMIKKVRTQYFTYLSENSIEEINTDKDMPEEIIIKPNTKIYQDEENTIPKTEENNEKIIIKPNTKNYQEKEKTTKKTKANKKTETIKVKPFKKIDNIKFENKMPFEILIIRRFLAVKNKEKISELFAYMKKKALNNEILKANVGGNYMVQIQKALQQSYNQNKNINKVIPNVFTDKEVSKMTQLADAYKSNPVASIYRYYINQVEPNFSKESILNIKNKINLLNKRYNIKELPYSNLLKDIENNINHKKEIELLPLLAGVKSNKKNFKQNLNKNKVFNLFENIQKSKEEKETNDLSIYFNLSKPNKLFFKT